jgi:hypothetical protein
MSFRRKYVRFIVKEDGDSTSDVLRASVHHDLIIIPSKPSTTFPAVTGLPDSLLMYEMCRQLLSSIPDHSLMSQLITIKS